MAGAQMEADLSRLDKTLFAICGVDVRALGQDGARMPDGFRVRTYFLSFARKYAEVGQRFGCPAPVRTARALLEVLLAERADDSAALRLRAELSVHLGDERDALDASAEFTRLSLGSARQGQREPRTPQSPAGPAHWTALGTPANARLAATPATAQTARSIGYSSAQHPPPAPPWNAGQSPRQPFNPPKLMARLAGFAPVSSLSDAFAALTPTDPLDSSPRAASVAAAGGGAEHTPTSARGVLGRKAGPHGSASIFSPNSKSSLAGSVPRLAASALRSPVSGYQSGNGGAEQQLPSSAPRSAARPLSAQRANVVASRVQLQQEIRQWRRQLARAQAVGEQFADRAGPEAEWVFKYLALEAEEREQTPAHGHLRAQPAGTPVH
ncbi:hypothetical protein T492DRAFT_1070772 [Pavlovales sp. CCMP2436]|nr:hypothetical protein T492DRAFT_1070772 [Pavlovales sp. CCMP2436]